MNSGMLFYMVAGSYANATISISQTKTVTTEKYQTKKISKELLPDISDVILNSSTPGSTKKFSITVDDAGTLKATEVTDA